VLSLLLNGGGTMSQQSWRMIRPDRIEGLGKNGPFTVSDFNITGLKTKSQFFLTVNINSKATGDKNKLAKGGINLPPIQFMGRPEELIKFFGEILAAVAVTEKGYWDGKEAEIEVEAGIAHG
jgi:hypothetical protein